LIAHAKIMRLKPRQPPGRSDRKARRYVNDIRCLREEGYTFETIRQALLDAGVSVSLSTVIREARRPPSQWEIELAQAEQGAEEESHLPSAAPQTGNSAQALDAKSVPQSCPASGEAVGTLAEANGNRKSGGWLSGFFAALRLLRRACPFT
jgi:hypothetical protein